MQNTFEVNPVLDIQPKNKMSLVIIFPVRSYFQVQEHKYPLGVKRSLNKIL